ncbi:unnamed protein product [Allacma fusca]|uniref:Uncharacterized protein n=1 Tax=Allacma fusca TaxID=39272 RepID=A0A8J2JQI1_9HEXA|nr:unnamed protein product [Allacma fusca]
MALYLTIILQVFGVQAAIDHSIGYFPADISPGLKSIGIEPFLSEKAAKSVLRVRDSKNQELKLYLYPVYYKGEPLFAWFRVQGKINNGGIRWFAIQAESKESKHSVGEFFHPEFISDKSSCFSSLTYSSVPSDPEKLTKYNFLPSLYSPNPSVTVPVGFVFKTENPSSFPSEINLLWRMSMSLCGFDDKNPVLFRGYALNHDDSTGLVTAETPEILYKDFLYGAHDPKPPKNADLSCNSQQMPQWVEGVTNTMNLKDASSTCSDALKDRPYDHFYGRCNIYRNSSKPSEVYECKGNNKFYSSLPAQTAATARAGSLTPDLIFCIGPNSTCTGIYEILEAKGIATTSYLGSVIMEAREAHGILMVIVTFFLIPVTSFTTRYFKETFLTRRVLHNHIWYCVYTSMVYRRSLISKADSCLHLCN